MDPLAPIAGLSLEQYAELRALCADHPDDADACARVVQSKNVSREDWLAAHAGWLARLEDPALGGAVAVRFVPAYQAGLGRAKGPAPALSFEEYVELSAQIMHAGLSSTLARQDLDLFRYTQIAFHWNAAMSRDMQTFVAYVCAVEHELLRLHRGGERRPIPTLATLIGTQATAFAQPAEPPAAPTNEPASAAAPAAAPEPAPAPAPEPAAAPEPAPAPEPAAAPEPAPAAAPTPAPTQQPKSLEQEAADAARAVEGALKNGFDKLGHALDSFGKSLSKPGVGSTVLVAWSDGNKYPGTVAQIAQGQYFVTMSNGEQYWVAEQYISAP
ncbi:hypothetical protein [Polyangium jinanense]|uniref:Uncharacterized protein n=1 Tax=Polyangium jinanense TaxID=2829994 RepID=A0A9X3XAT3_9BACT|nr:hypothetical protein [Polyangium jinanense]MDC3960119.1 hypothetical protein [Polyangium jinanense]MDC3984436.1 hypothetical protein [Polyangium jinanense]